jgi:hypothetical protein
VLRHLIKLLLENGHRRVGSQKYPGTWAPIREAQWRAMAADKLTALALAQKLGNQRIGYRQMLGAKWSDAIRRDHRQGACLARPSGRA